MEASCIRICKLSSKSSAESPMNGIECTSPKGTIGRGWQSGSLCVDSDYINVSLQLAVVHNVLVFISVGKHRSAYCIEQARSLQRTDLFSIMIEHFPKSTSASDHVESTWPLSLISTLQQTEQRTILNPNLLIHLSPNLMDPWRFVRLDRF